MQSRHHSRGSGPSHALPHTTPHASGACMLRTRAYASFAARRSVTPPGPMPSRPASELPSPHAAHACPQRNLRPLLNWKSDTLVHRVHPMTLYSIKLSESHLNLLPPAARMGGPGLSCITRPHPTANAATALPAPASAATRCAAPPGAGVNRQTASRCAEPRRPKIIVIKR